MEKIDETLQQLRGGDLKLRVRALELERAARRSSILQVPLHTRPVLFLCEHKLEPGIAHAVFGTTRAGRCMWPRQLDPQLFLAAALAVHVWPGATLR